MKKLDYLKHQLLNLNCYTEAKQIDILKISIMGPSDERIKELTDNSNNEGTHILLDMLGLAPGVGEIADFANAALYLSEGINVKSLFNAGISLTSMLTGLGDSSKALKYLDKVFEAKDLQVLQPIIRNIISKETEIKALFTRLKSTEVKKRLGDVPYGDLLIKYSDKMFEVIINWAKSLLNKTIADGLDAMISQ